MMDRMEPNFSWEWDDPAKVAERREQQEQPGCGRCIHKFALWGVTVCARHPGLCGAKMKLCDDHLENPFNV